ncbi:MAG: hypothetical protein JNM34_01640 [Chthonomonadaceae bacterium]|nr:hypothetical protein [Chthonomonadaceae bacterium]
MKTTLTTFAVATSVLTVALSVACLSARPLIAQVGSLPAYVRLQSTTPGTTQSGHANIAGTLRANSFEGGGTGLIGLDASQVTIGILDPARGGLGLDTSGATTGSLLVASGSGWSLLAPGNDGETLTLSGGAPVWTAATGGFSLPYVGSGTTDDAEGLLKTTNFGSGPALFGQTDHPQGIGVRGEAIDTTDYSYGGYFLASGSNGRALYALNTSASGASVAGRFGSASPDTVTIYSTASSTTGDATAILGESYSESGIGVYGKAHSVTPNRNQIGVQGDSSGSSGAGVLGYNTSPTGRSTGVWAASANISSGSAALLVFGNSLVAGTKQFRIDHPLDPENKYLHHYCTEGPAPYLEYKGRVVTDNQGYAWVSLPDYFAAINRDPDYQLTVVDSSEDFVLVKVTREIQNNRFQIRSNKPGVSVCWQVKGLRNDAWVRQSRVLTVEPKPESERGLYQIPQLYGQPMNSGILKVGKSHQRPHPPARNP